MRRTMLFVLLILTIALIVGCGGKKDAETAITKESANNEPVTIRIGTSGSATMSEMIFQETVVAPMKQKYPHITLELMLIPKGGFAEWIASGVIPDIILHANGSTGELFDYDLMTDITPLVKQTKTDLKRFDQAVLSSVQVASDQGWLVGLPYAQNFNAMYYNKDLFDRIGVNYPPDGITWDATIELSRKFGRADGGYVGLHPEWVLRPAYPLALTLVDPKTNKSQVTNDKWKSVAQLLQRIVAVPGNWDGKSSLGDFWGKQNIAMIATTNRFSSLIPAAETGFTRWDVTQYPSYPEQPGVSGMVDAWVMIMTKSSPHKLQAMQVMNTVTSDEVQLLAASKLAQMSTLANSAVKEQFGKEIPSLNMKEKNIQSIFKGRIIAAPKFSPYEKQARPFYQDNMTKVFSGAMDVNTALRDADEKINQMLTQQKK